MERPYIPKGESREGVNQADAVIVVELHCHTCYSKDSLMLPENVLRVSRERGIDKIAITDHNTIAGALRAAEMEPARVIVGEEIMTSKGELIAYFVHQEVPAGLDPEQVIENLRSQGAFIAVPHPLDRMRGGSWSMEDLESILPLVDALEIFNARNWSSKSDRRAAGLAMKADLLGTAGSDAHSYAEIGRVVMRTPVFHNAGEMRLALAKAQIVGRRSTPLIHLVSRYASIQKSLGWRPPI
jgi:predicted metal-dependent phosphoesterase TrpH